MVQKMAESISNHRHVEVAKKAKSGMHRIRCFIVAWKKMKVLKNEEDLELRMILEEARQMMKEQPGKLKKISSSPGTEILDGDENGWEKGVNPVCQRSWW